MASAPDGTDGGASATDHRAAPGTILDLMCRFDIEQVPVLRDGRPVGIVAHHDLLKLVLDEVENGDGSAVEGAE